MFLMRPMAVLSPVPMTIPRALPAATLVPENTMFFLSYNDNANSSLIFIVNFFSIISR